MNNWSRGLYCRPPPGNSFSVIALAPDQRPELEIDMIKASQDA